MRLLYSFFIFCYSILLKIAASFNSKAKLWNDGRKDLFKKLETEFSKLDSKTTVVWMHCASLGEFEQGRPLLERIKATKPETKLLLTFFSPSGFEIRKNYSGVDWVFYLPIDSQSNAKKFIELVKPQKVIFVKYEFWFNYLESLYQKQIPTYFISVNVRPDHYFLKWYGSWALQQLKKVNHFFVQNSKSLELLAQVGVSQCSVAGDTRFDRVIDIASKTQTIPLIEHFCDGKKVIVAGSTWPEDEKILAEWMLKNKSTVSNHKLILAPHEIDANSLTKTEALFSASKTIRYSNIQAHSNDGFDVILIDNIGMLSTLYKYALLTYIGGGFGSGIHNILEAAVYGKPVIFGPNYQKFEEAKNLIASGGANCISSYEQFDSCVAALLVDEKKYREQCQISQNFVRDNAGAVERILNAI